MVHSPVMPGVLSEPDLPVEETTIPLEANFHVLQYVNPKIWMHHDAHALNAQPCDQSSLSRL